MNSEQKNNKSCKSCKKTLVKDTDDYCYRVECRLERGFDDKILTSCKSCKKEIEAIDDDYFIFDEEVEDKTIINDIQNA